jgi:hypothetical protein
MTGMWMLIAYSGDGRTGFIIDNDPAMAEGGNPILDTDGLEDTDIYVPPGLEKGIYRVDQIKFSDNGDDPPEISGQWRRLTLVG